MIGDANLVNVEDAGSEEHAAPWAHLWCNRYGKTERFKGTEKHQISRYAHTIDVQFECVAPESSLQGAQEPSPAR